MTEDVQHPSILYEHAGLEHNDSRSPCRSRQVFEKLRGQAEMLMVIGDHEGHLGFRGPWGAVIPPYGDQLTVMLHDHGQSGDIVHLRKVADLLRGQLGMKVEVPPIDGRGREQSVELGELKEVRLIPR